jgi:hypothetical protein
MPVQQDKPETPDRFGNNLAKYEINIDENICRKKSQQKRLSLEVIPAVPDVIFGRLRDVSPFIFRNRADDLCWHTSHKHSCGHRKTLPDKRTGGDNRPLLDDTVVKQHRTHAYKHMVLDRACMKHRTVTYGDAAADVQRACIMRHMKGDIVLHVCFFSDTNRADISADNGIEPDARISTDMDISDDKSPFSQKYRFMQPGPDSPVW